MDISTFNHAKQAYAAKSWDTAVILFSQCGTGPGTGEACHLCGNALMRLGRVQEAIKAYRAATIDVEYQNQGAVYTNLGKAQMVIGDYRGAIDSLRHALSDTSYRGVYKTYLALGEAYLKMADARSAGIAFRKAAMEENNPEPAKALINLGVCFMQLSRPADAAEAYRTAIEYATSDSERCLLRANLGQAYVASNRMMEAVQVFEAAMSGGYQLPPAAAADYARAKATIGGNGPQPVYQTAPGGIDGFSPEASGEFLPSPEKSGFFEIPTDEYAMAREAKKERHAGVAVLITVIVILLFAAGGIVFAYFRGLGLPSQETVVEELFTSLENGVSANDVWASSVSDTDRSSMLAAICTDGEHSIEGISSDATESKVLVTVQLTQGGLFEYSVSLVREGIGWKVSEVVELVSSRTESTYASLQSQGTDVASAQADESSQADAAPQAEEGAVASEEVPAAE